MTKRFYWDEEERRLVPAAEYLEKRRKSSYGAFPQISVFKSGMNHSLGAYCGSRRDVVDACNRIEDKTGSRPVEIGDQHVKHSPELTPYEIPRDALR